MEEEKRVLAQYDKETTDEEYIKKKLRKKDKEMMKEEAAKIEAMDDQQLWLE